MQGKEKQGKAVEADLWKSVPFPFICGLIATKATFFAKTPSRKIFPKAPRKPQTARNTVNSCGMWLPGRNFLASFTKIHDQLLLIPSKGRTHP